ncbi:MAG: aminoacyl-tRNA hydrolase [Elusimicrobiota bacterium]
MVRLAVGLGNPGPAYAGTRHNIGFMLLDKLLGTSPWKRWGEGEAAFHGLEGTDRTGFHCFKPLTFMNLSGGAVRAFADYHKVAPADILACYDDIDLPLGRIRIRLGGSSGGHRGMQSLIESFGGEEGIPRLRLGVGPLPEKADAKNFVLGHFRSDEADTLSGMLERGMLALGAACAHGIEKAMNEFNPAS